MILFGKKSEKNDSSIEFVKTYVIKQEKEQENSLYPKIYWNFSTDLQVNAKVDCHKNFDKNDLDQQSSRVRDAQKLDHIKNVHIPKVKTKNYLCLACSTDYFNCAESLKEHMLQSHCDTQSIK